MSGHELGARDMWESLLLLCPFWTAPMKTRRIFASMEGISVNQAVAYFAIPHLGRGTLGEKDEERERSNRT